MHPAGRSSRRNTSRPPTSPRSQGTAGPKTNPVLTNPFLLLFSSSSLLALSSSSSSLLALLSSRVSRTGFETRLVSTQSGNEPVALAGARSAGRRRRALRGCRVARLLARLRQQQWRVPRRAPSRLGGSVGRGCSVIRVRSCGYAPSCCGYGCASVAALFCDRLRRCFAAGCVAGSRPVLRPICWAIKAADDEYRATVAIQASMAGDLYPSWEREWNAGLRNLRGTASGNSPGPSQNVPAKPGAYAAPSAPVRPSKTPAAPSSAAPSGAAPSSASSSGLPGETADEALERILKTHKAGKRARTEPQP